MKNTMSKKELEQFNALIEYYCEECGFMYEDAERQALIDLGFESEKFELIIGIRY